MPLALTSLDISFNKLPASTNISPLSQLSSLRDLILRGNPIERLIGLSLVSVQTLDLAYTCIHSWTDFQNTMMLCPNTTMLLLQGTSLSRESSARLFVIARLERLTSLNHSDVSSAERRNAEILYLNTIARLWQIKDHPRWYALCKIHGTPDLVVEKQGVRKPHTLASNVARFYFHFEEQQESRLLPLSTSIYRLAGIAASFFDLRTIEIILFLETDDLDPVQRKEVNWDEDETDYESKWVERSVELLPSSRSIKDHLPHDFGGRDAAVRIRVSVC